MEKKLVWAFGDHAGEEVPAEFLEKIKRENQDREVTEGGAVFVNDELCIFPAKDPGAEQIDNVLQSVEGIAEKLEGLRAALEDVSSDQGKADVIEGACRRAARQLLAIADQGGISVEDL